MRLLFSRVRLVHQPHFHPFPGGTKLGYLARRVYDKVAGRLILRMADKIVLMSKAEKKNLLTTYNDGRKITLIPHGISRLNKGDYHRDVMDFRKRRGIDEKDFIVLCVSRVGIELIEFFIELIGYIRGRVKIVIVGGVWGRNNTINEMNQRIKESGLEEKIYLTGYLTERQLNIAYRSADIFIKPTHFEAFGIVFLEAMDAGLPIVTHRVGALPELIDEGVNGFLFEENDIAKMAEKINELVLDKNLRESISRKNQEKAKKYYWDNILERYIEIYEELAEDLRRSKLKGKSKKVNLKP